VKTVKGVELPINILVVVAIAVIVLLGLIALYFIGFGPFSGATGLEGVKNEACRQYVQNKNCAGALTAVTIPNYDADGDKTIDEGSGFVDDDCADAATQDNLRSLCECQYARGTDADCRKLCGCP
jgi:hypothetical protein